MDRFTELLTDLGSQLGLPLYPDKLGVCKLNVNNVFHVQIENDPRKESLLIATFIGEIVPGKFRENILKEGLKANKDIRGGTLAYCGKNNQLALFKYTPIKNVNGASLLTILNEFIDRASNWRIAVESGVIPVEKRL